MESDMQPRMASMSRRAASPYHVRPGEVSCFDFLSKPGVFVANLPVDEHGAAELAGYDLSTFSSVQVIASNPECVSQRVQPLSGTVHTASLVHKLTFDLDKTYAEQLKCSAVKTGETFTVKDAASRTKIVDSVEKQLSLLNEVSKSLNRPQIAWKWLGEWDRLSAEEKTQKYDEFASHELNLFLHSKDPVFFAEVVRPFLNEKFERTFVDKWLLEESLEEYLNVLAGVDSLGTKLNGLELALLVKAVRTSHPEAAEQLVTVMEAAVKARPRNEEERRRLFS
jgi:hypothetical protein